MEIRRNHRFIARLRKIPPLELEKIMGKIMCNLSMSGYLGVMRMHHMPSRKIAWSRELNLAHDMIKRALEEKCGFHTDGFMD